MNKHLIAFLLGIGIDKKVIDELAAQKDEDTVDLTDRLQAFKDNQRTLYENDADLVAKISGAAVGKLTDSVTRKLKADFGLKPEDLKDLKKVEDIIALAKKVSSEGKDKPLQDLEQQLMAANAKIKEFEEVVIPAEQAKATSHIKSFDREVKFKSLFTDKYRVPIEAAFPSVKTALEAKYDFDFDDKGELVAYQKGTKLMAKNKDNTGVLSVSDLIKEQAEAFKFIEESNADDTGKTNPATIVKVDDPTKNDNKMNVPHLAAAQKKLDEMKKESAASAKK